MSAADICRERGWVVDNVLLSPLGAAWELTAVGKASCLGLVLGVFRGGVFFAEAEESDVRARVQHDWAKATPEQLAAIRPPAPAQEWEGSEDIPAGTYVVDAKPAPGWTVEWDAEAEEWVPRRLGTGAHGQGFQTAGDAVTHTHGAATTPDPTHTPAVRRVVAWEAGDGPPCTDINEAYMEAANHLIERSWPKFARRVGWADRYWSAWRRVCWPTERRKRLAAYLRHRDERAGYR